MKINQEFFNYIRPYLAKIQTMIGGNFVVFGSAPLYLLGVVKFNGKINDLDISIKNSADIPKDVQMVTFHKDQNQKFYKIIIDDIEVDMASLWPGQEYFFNKIHTDPIIVEEFKFANLEVIKEWKMEMVRKYNRLKDKEYLEKIDNFQNQAKNKEIN
jgi:hypothetical protein